MKKKLIMLPLIAGLAAALAGCVDTVDGRSETGVPWVPDKANARYANRSLPQVLDAAKVVLRRDGALTAENTLNNSLEARVNQRIVFVKVTEEDPVKPITDLTVQVRTKYGGTDRELAHQLEKEIALELTR